MRRWLCIAVAAAAAAWQRGTLLWLQLVDVAAVRRAMQLGAVGGLSVVTMAALAAAVAVIFGLMMLVEA